MKKFLICLGSVIGIVFLTWGLCELADSGSYNYRGYITKVDENENGETIITTISGTQESTFTLKWYTRKNAEQKQPIAVGARILLSTAHNSETNIKKLKVMPGYSTVGKVVYIEGIYHAFALGTIEETGMKYLVNMIGSPKGLNTGDLVRFFHDRPVYTNSVSVTSDGSVRIEQGSVEDITEEEIAFIESKGYRLKIQ